MRQAERSRLLWMLIASVGGAAYVGVDALIRGEKVGAERTVAAFVLGALSVPVGELVYHLSQHATAPEPEPDAFPEEPT